MLQESADCSGLGVIKSQGPESLYMDLLGHYHKLLTGPGVHFAAALLMFFPPDLTADKWHHCRTHQGLRLEKGRAVYLSDHQGDGQGVLSKLGSSCRQWGNGSPDAVAPNRQTGTGLQAG